MSAAALLARTREAGAVLSVAGTGLVVDFASRLPADLLAALRVHKAEVLALLAVDEAAYAAEERAAIQAEALPDPEGPIPHRMPPSWGDPAIEPTAGAECFCCAGRAWWRRRSGGGWCCSICHPGAHLPAGLVQMVVT